MTPMFEQYLALKAQHPSSILFFRMGDFYEMFYEDAELAARELDLTLTARNKQQDNPIPMAGVPHHASAGYIERLVERDGLDVDGQRVGDARLHEALHLLALGWGHCLGVGEVEARLGVVDQRPLLADAVAQHLMECEVDHVRERVRARDGRAPRVVDLASEIVGDRERARAQHSDV